MKRKRGLPARLRRSDQIAGAVSIRLKELRLTPGCYHTSYMIDEILALNRLVEGDQCLEIAPEDLNADPLQPFAFSGDRASTVT